MEASGRGRGWRKFSFSLCCLVCIHEFRWIYDCVGRIVVSVFGRIDSFKCGGFVVVVVVSSIDVGGVVVRKSFLILKVIIVVSIVRQVVSYWNMKRGR